MASLKLLMAFFLLSGAVRAAQQLCCTRSDECRDGIAAGKRHPSTDGKGWCAGAFDCRNPGRKDGLDGELRRSKRSDKKAGDARHAV